jgi:hypothetical protein
MMAFLMTRPEFCAAALLALLLTGCGFGVRVPFVGVGVRVLKQDASASRNERVVTMYTHDGKTDRLEVSDGRVVLNAIDYGPVQQGDQVVLTEQGLLVNGELRKPKAAQPDK